MESTLPTIIQYRRDIWQLFKDIPPSKLGGAVEIGCAEGNFSEDLLKMPVDFPIVYLVDRWQEVRGMRGDSANSQVWHEANLTKVISRISPYNNRARIMRGDSVAQADNVANESLSLVYIDADHSYHGCKRDIAAWYPKLMVGGYIAFHDFQQVQYGVNRAVREACMHFNKQAHNLCVMAEDKLEDAGAYFQKLESC